MIEVEALLELLDLRCQRHRIGGVALEHLDGNGAAIRGAEQAVDNLQCALLAVAAIAPPGERAAAAFHVARRDVVQHQRAVGEMTSGQRGLDRGLARQQPVQCMVEFVLIDVTETEQFAEARRGGSRRQRTCGGEFGCRVDDPTDDESEDEITATIVAVISSSLSSSVGSSTLHPNSPPHVRCLRLPPRRASANCSVSVTSMRTNSTMHWTGCWRASPRSRPRWPDVISPTARW